MLFTPLEESNVSRGAGRSVVVEWSEALQSFIIAARPIAGRHVDTACS